MYTANMPHYSACRLPEGAAPASAVFSSGTASVLLATSARLPGIDVALRQLPTQYCLPGAVDVSTGTTHPSADNGIILASLSASNIRQVQYLTQQFPPPSLLESCYHFSIAKKGTLPEIFLFLMWNKRKYL